ncbi:MAG TPA: polymerase, partial [Neisseria sp.]|nr:polymerase [Neisseria sp.]
ALLLITGLLRLAWVYHDLTAFSVQGKNDSAATIVQKTEGLLKIAETEPLLRYYAQLSLTRRANPADPMVQPGRRSGSSSLVFPPLCQHLPSGLVSAAQRASERSGRMAAKNL